MPAMIVAHRGDCSRAHENTIAAFRDAITHGADMIEFDVRRTVDGTLVVHHDDTIGDALLGALEYAAARAMAGALGYDLPSLEEVLDATSRNIPLDIELKEGGCEETVIDMLFRRGLTVDDFVVTSFDGGTLARVTRVAPAVRTGLLVEQMEGLGTLDGFHRSPARFLAPGCALLDPATLAAAAERDVPLMAWTVNDAAMMRRLFDAPAVIGVITDRLGLAQRVRAQTDARS